MKDIAFHITDIAENSLRAGAADIEVRMGFDGRWLVVCVNDDGCGMSGETLRKITNPFYTTRTTRSIGLGIPFLLQSAEQTGGRVEIRSAVGVGTSVVATFDTSHIDCPPLGDVATSAMILLSGNEQVSILFSVTAPDEQFSISTTELHEALGDLPLGLPEVATQIREIIADNVKLMVGI